MTAGTHPLHRIAYSDESSWNVGRYRAVAAISVPEAQATQTNLRISSVLKDSGVNEFAWKKVADARYRFAAMKLVDLVLASLRTVRVDVLLWDTYDRRHDIQGRDDIRNLERMYYWLFKTTMERLGGTWTLRPDEHSAIDWATLGKVLAHSSRRHNRRYQVLETLARSVSVRGISPCVSKANPVVQLADLMCGLVVYSWSSYGIYESFCNLNQARLLDVGDPVIGQTDTERCAVLSHFDRGCKARALRISLKTHRGLCSKGPGPVRVWRWQVQHELDRAPLRLGGRGSGG